jgi:hypothetical protein
VGGSPALWAEARLFTELTTACGWDGATYEQWLAGMLTATTRRLRS